MFFHYFLYMDRYCIKVLFLMIDLGEDFFNFVESHRHDDTSTLRLKYTGRVTTFPLDLALTQIEARRKAASKLAPFFKDARFLVPSVLSTEQASDWRVARHHASDVTGLRVLDLTAGLGVDVMSMAMGGAEVTAVEIEEEKCDVLRYNTALAGLSVTVLHGDANDIVKSLPPDSFDIIYIDPARRDSAGRRTYAFSDCRPDVNSLLPFMLTVAPKVIIKASPLLDITAIIGELPGIEAIEVVSVRGEVKELLITVGRNQSADSQKPDVKITMIDSEGEFSGLTLHMDDLGTGEVIYADEDIRPGMWLCEPDAAIMKCAPWGILSNRFHGLKKISRDTHLFLSEDYPEGFPGRIVRINCIPDKRQLKLLAGKHINVSTRNFPGGTDALRKRLRLIDGGEDFIYGFRSANGRPVIACCTAYGRK